MAWHATRMNQWHKHFTCQYVEDAVAKTVSTNVDPITINL